jgi:TorA maturation chaperone TorD
MSDPGVVDVEAADTGRFDGAVEIALARGALYEALTIALRPPSGELSRRLARPTGALGLRVAASLIDDGALAARVDRLTTVASDETSLRRTYERLFGHTARGEASPYETEYGADDLFQQPQAMADVAGFYAAFGLVTRGGERPDHASGECEFLMVLARREALAHERHDDAEVALVRRATRLFLRDHLARFAPAFAEQLRRADPAGFYGALGALLDAFVTGECARLGVTRGPVGLALRPAEEDRVPMACGRCPLGDGDAEDDDAPRV